MHFHRILVAIVIGSLVAPTTADSQENVGGLFRDYVVVQKESAEAKKERLRWISEERNRIRDELKQFDSELAELEGVVPRAVPPRDMPPAQRSEREREKKNFEAWVVNNDPKLQNSIFRSSALNALLRVLGPIAHYRKIRTGDAPAAMVFPSLSPTERIEADESVHYRLNPANSSGQKTVVRLNRLPLEIVWPDVLIQKWKADCDHLNKARDAFVSVLSVGSDETVRIERADLLDKSLSLLQAKVQKAKREAPHDILEADLGKRVQNSRDFDKALRYLYTIRATVDRLKKVPLEYQVLRFPGGSIEEFLDFCYRHDMILQEAEPADEGSYTMLYRRLQDYARDVQYVEDWRTSVAQRMTELTEEDKKLVWRASEQ